MSKDDAGPDDPSADQSASEAAKSKPSPSAVLWLFEFAERIVADPVRSIPLAGLALYAISRLSLAIFYMNFGVAPEDVGYGYVETLARSLYGLAVYLLLIVTVEYGIPLLGAVLTRLYYAIRREESDSIRTLMFTLGGPHRQAALFFILLLFPAYYLGGLLVRAYHDGQEAALGSPAVYTVFSPFRAEAALIRLIDPTREFSLEDGQCILFLGDADGTTIVYDPKTRITHRIPSGSVSIETSTSFREIASVPAGCPE